MIVNRMPSVYKCYRTVKKMGNRVRKKKSWFCGKNPEEAAEKLAVYDVISFDVFDTLIFRPYIRPTELFQTVAEKTNIPNFKAIRCEMEQKAREELYKRERSTEVTLDEIYKVMSRDAGIEKEVKEMELSLEYQVCYANPYMRQVVEALKKYQKRMIVISDMYMNQIQICKILEYAGYDKFDAYYVSSDYRKSKSNGELYEIVKVKEGRECSFAHVGDNIISDIKQAKKYGIHAFYYQNE